MDLSHIICDFEHTKNLPLTECAKWLFFGVKGPKIEKTCEFLESFYSDNKYANRDIKSIAMG